MSANQMERTSGCIGIGIPCDYLVVQWDGKGEDGELLNYCLETQRMGGWRESVKKKEEILSIPH